MQTHFTDTQLEDPQLREADSILRKCVHCGFCTATCPTYLMTGDERDSPRGRIWMMRELLESPDSVSSDTGYHLDLCLGCLACTTTCPSGVDYHHLIEIGRERMDKIVSRPAGDRMMRWLLARVIPYPGRITTLDASDRAPNQGKIRWPERTRRLTTRAGAKMLRAGVSDRDASRGSDGRAASARGMG